MARWGLNAMLNFSLRHSLHSFLTGLKSEMLASKIFQVNLGLLPFSSSFQRCLLLKFSSSIWGHYPSLVPSNNRLRGYLNFLDL